MRLKKPVDQIYWEINGRAQSQAKSALSALGYGGPMDQISNTLAQAIATAVAEGFRVMMENQYTDDDFEKDMTLKDR